MFGRDEKVSAIRLTAAQYIILGIFLILAYGLWRLQVMQSDYYSLAAEKNRIRNVPVLAPRGKILDREGRTIVDNYPSFSALLLRDSSRDLVADADMIAQGLHLDPNEVRARIRRAPPSLMSDPCPLPKSPSPTSLPQTPSSKPDPAPLRPDAPLVIEVDDLKVWFPIKRGVLRRVVPQWLRMPDLRPLILGFEEAHHGHGGSGALYVRLRRIRRSREP